VSVRELKDEAQRARHARDYARAIELYERAVALARDANDPLLLAHTIRHLADVHIDANQHQRAHSHYAEALAIYRAHETRPLDLANTLRGYAIEREEARAFDEALAMWEEARALYTATNVEPGVAEATRRIAKIRNPR